MSIVTARSSFPAGPGVVRLAAVALVAIILFAYRGGFEGEFVFDDELSVADNVSIRRLSDFGAVLSPPATSPLGGRPVANLTFALNYAAGGTRVGGYRGLNIGFHAISALLLFGIVRRTVARTPRNFAEPDKRLWLAFAIALLWAVHPVVTGTILYVAQRTEALMGLFYLLTLYAFIRASETDSRMWSAVSVVACALGMGSKEVMVTAPVMVWWYDRTFVSGAFRAALQGRWRYYAALGATWLLLAGFMSTGLDQRSVGYGLGVTWWRYALTECGAVLLYLRRAIWPHPLIFDYGPTFVSDPMTAWPSVLAMLAIIAGVGVLLWKRPGLGFLAAGFLVVLAPTSSVVPIATQPIAESRMYLPLAFVMTSLGLAGHAIGKRRSSLLLAGIAVAFVIMTGRRTEVFKNAASLWVDTLVKSPENGRAHSNYGAILLARGKIDEAIEHTRRALALTPNVASVHSNYGAALFVRGETEEAIAQARRAIALDPRLPRVHANLAAALNKKGEYQEALQLAQRALELLPDITDANYQIGNALLHLGRAVEAIPHYQAEIRLRPDYADARSNLGSALYILGRPAEALEHFTAALKLHPDSTDAQDNAAAALTLLGRLDEAISMYRSSLKTRPDVPLLHSNLAIVLIRAGRFDEAEAEFRIALRLEPGNQASMRGLAELETRRQQRAPR